MNSLPLLPRDIGDIETKAILKKLTKAHQALAELKGVVNSIPNQGILISTLALQEAKDSSEIENIITTQDDLYRSDRQAKQFVTVAAKEVHNYAAALRDGFEQVKTSGLLIERQILEIQATIEENDAGFRRLPGTALKNEATGEVVYTPPQSYEEIKILMANLEQFINDEDFCDLDPLTKMAIIHHQFESIHPFYDGNGRTGRIINVLYLVKQNLLNIPVLYLSRYINQNKAKYYELLQSTRTTGNWEAWVMYMLEAVEQTSRQTIELTKEIKHLMVFFKQTMRTELPKIYSQDLLNNLFYHPYTKIEFVVDELRIGRKTASKYLESLVEVGLLSKHRIAKENYYLNDRLFALLLNVGTKQENGS